MELPIQLKFFKKIELYQEYKFEEQKSLETKLQDWKIEKAILKWTRTNHHHLASPIDANRINKEILGNKYSHEHQHAMGSLVQRGYADIYPANTDMIRPESITITKDGLIMGEIVYDIENNKFKKITFEFFYWLVWIVAFSGAFILIESALKILIGYMHINWRLEFIEKVIETICLQ